MSHLKVILDGDELPHGYGVVLEQEGKDGLGTAYSGRLNVRVTNEAGHPVLVRQREDGSLESLRRLSPDMELSPNSDVLKVSDAIPAS